MSHDTSTHELDSLDPLQVAAVYDTIQRAEYDRAINQLEEIADQDPAQPGVLRLIAALETSRRNTLAACAAWYSVVQVVPHDADALLQLALANFEIVAFDAAREAAEAALAIDPNLAEAHYIRAQVRERDEGTDAVWPDLMRAFTLHPTACPLPIPIDDPRALYAQALRHTARSVRMVWHGADVVFEAFPDTADLRVESPPLSPRILAICTNEPGAVDDGSPKRLRIFVGNLRYHDDLDHAAEQLAITLESEARHQQQQG